ncbi:MAG: WecB/TagA/CpsF family glycosyltransferase [Spirulina sp. SIO3F2]|nr:WecB/TagA/CpsF family glycosyltransferase [Spirulina sp. SIO3F2]
MVKIMDYAELPYVKLGRLWLHQIDESQAVKHLLEQVEAGRGGWVVTPNLDYIRRAQKDDEFLELCQSANLSLADGMPLVWASKLLKNPLPERVAGSNLITSLSCAAARHGHTIYLIGGDSGTAAAAAEVLKQRCPGLEVVGIDPMPPGFEKTPNAMEQLIKDLQEKQPAIVFVALGSPKEEMMCRNLSRHLPNMWFLAVGISYSYLCGRIKRAPIWMQNCGLEWFYRLLTEPRRLVRRYLVEGIPFAIIFLLKSAWAGCKMNRKR